MLKHTRLEHRFVKHVPDTLEPGILYVSVEFSTVVHTCCCGCGEEVVTPLTPTDWTLAYNGETVSLAPSVGSWTLRCRSHYVIRHGLAIVASPWTKEQIAAERTRDARAKAQHYARPPAVPTLPVVGPPRQTDDSPARRVPIWERVRRWWRR